MFANTAWLCLRNIISSSRLGNRRHLFFCWIFFDVENTRSEGALEAGTARYFLAKIAMLGYALQCASHHARGSADR